MAETVGGGPFSPWGLRQPLFKPPINLSSLEVKAEVEFLTHLA